MSKLLIELKNFNNRLLSLKNNFGLLFYLILFCILIVEFFVVQDALRTVVNSAKDQAPSHVAKKVRLNFTDYNSNLDRLERNQNFQPGSESIEDPFKSR